MNPTLKDLREQVGLSAKEVDQARTRFDGIKPTSGIANYEKKGARYVIQNSLISLLAALYKQDRDVILRAHLGDERSTGVDWP